MSFFGFDSALPRDRPHDTRAPGFGQAPDPFAALSRHEVPEDEDDGDVLDFEDTYDGLGDQLDETDDIHNADTFGNISGASLQRGKGNDFDFSGQTAKMADTLDEEHMFFAARRPQQSYAPPPRAPQQPARTGYESYREPEYIPQLEANASIWGMESKPSKAQAPVQAQPTQTVAGSRKMMSLEEVEAMMQSRNPAPAAQPTTTPQHPAQVHQGPQILRRPQEPARPSPQPQYDQIHLREQQQQQQMFGQHVPQSSLDMHSSQASGPSHQYQAHQDPSIMNQPRTILQNPMHAQHPAVGHASQQSIDLQKSMSPNVHHIRDPSLSEPVVPQSEQLLHLTGAERATYLIEDAKRAKRNYKIHLLSKNNGFMTPQDKNFITRIQLQQLVTATGGTEEHDPEAPLTEDFYYQVYSQIRGAPRQNPNQPLSHFAQTYLHQTGGRAGGRRHPRGADSHMRRMEQQVQRAVEAAKLKPKNKQLILEGSLGKISFSNAKTPKPLLNIQRSENGHSRNLSVARAQANTTNKGWKTVLRDIENVYGVLMKMEDHERRMPAPPNEESSADVIEGQMEWRRRLQSLNEELWEALKVREPIVPNSAVPHPFIGILSHAKGKKLIPRVFRQIDEQQRITILTMIVVHLDVLDVIRLAYLYPEETQIPRNVRDEVELFSQAVMPSLFGYVSDAPLGTVIGLLSLVMDRSNMKAVVRTKIGIGFLTMFVSRAELIKQGGQVDQVDKRQWAELYDRLFNVLEPELPDIFPSPLTGPGTSTGPSPAGEDTYVWQFLAALSIGAGPQQQQRLVLAVKDRVMDTVALAKTLPADMAKARLDNVNLFMRAIGLDVELLG